MIPVNLHTIAQDAGVLIVQLTSENVAEIIACPQAQLRTAKYKKAVYLAGKLVFKGPYNSHDAALINNLRFNDLRLTPAFGAIAARRQNIEKTL